MANRRADENDPAIEGALSTLFHRPSPDPRFLARLEKDLLAHSAVLPVRRSWRKDLPAWFSTSARTVAWAGGALLFFFLLVWTVSNLAIKPAADTPSSSMPGSPAKESQPTAGDRNRQNLPPNAGSEIGTPQNAILYTVQAGDSVFSISEQTGISIETIRTLNNIQSGDILVPGRQLVLGFIGRSPVLLTAVPEPAQPSPAVVNNLATASPTPPETAALALNQITVNAVVPLANLRSGPSTDFAIVGSLSAGMQAEVVGQTDQGEWLQIVFPTAPGGVAWIYSPLVTQTGASLPVVAAPPTPTPLPPELSPLPKTKAKIILILADADQAGSDFDASQGELYFTYILSNNPDQFRLARISIACLGQETRCDLAPVRGFPGQVNSPLSWSRDGSQAVVYDDANARLVIYDPQDRSWQPVAGKISLQFPELVWSPDGKWIAAATSGGDGAHSEILLVRQDGEKNRPVAADLPGLKSPLGWLDERTLVLIRHPVQLNAAGEWSLPGLYKVNIDSGEIQVIAPDVFWRDIPALAPDGSLLAITTTDSGMDELAWLNPKNNKLTATKTNGASPVWSPDGRWVAITSVQETWEQLFVVRADNGNLRNVFPWHGQVLWLPDAKHLIVESFLDRLLGGDDRVHYYLVSIPEGTFQELLLGDEGLIDLIMAPSVRPMTP